MRPGVGVSLVIQAAHIFPSDVAAGYLSPAVGGRSRRWLLPERPSGRGEDRGEPASPSAGLAVLGFAVAVAVAVVEHPGIVVRVEDRTKLVFALTVLAGLALAVAVGFAAIQAIALRSASTTRS